MKMEVRCCCNPGKLLGTLEVDRPYRAGEKIPVVSKNASFDVLQVAHLHSRRTEALAQLDAVRSEIPGFCYYPAIKSDDRPMSFWRGLPGFEEAENSPVNWE